MTDTDTSNDGKTDFSGLSARVLQSVSDIAASDWDAHANPPHAAYNPFLRHAFFKAVEESGSAQPETGWIPQHIVVENGAGDIIGIAPSYAKTHSQGEYVFDHSWANALERAGGSYYPKLQIAVPFTPATGRRLLTRFDGQVGNIARRSLLDALRGIVERAGLSSAHITFLTNEEAALGNDAGYLLRMDQQFHWQNDGYQNFDDFLAALNSQKRKQIRRERRDAVGANGIEIVTLSGDQLEEDHWEAFYQFYIDTGYRKWGSPYLTREFFSLINQSMPEDILLVMARRDGKWIAGALNFIGSDALFGRNWGAIEHHKFLHFELCYYQAIDFAIRRGLSRVEAGAQGSHKLARGYVPSLTHSLHYISHEGFRAAVEDYLEGERRAVAEDQAWLNERAPFKKGDYDFTSPVDDSDYEPDTSHL